VQPSTGLSTKILLITVAAAIAAIVIVVCVVRGFYTVGEGLRVVGFTAIVGALFAIFGIGGAGDGWFGAGGDGAG
jgi:hypothetical protein